MQTLHKWLVCETTKSQTATLLKYYVKNSHKYNCNLLKFEIVLNFYKNLRLCLKYEKSMNRITNRPDGRIKEKEIQKSILTTSYTPNIIP